MSPADCCAEQTEKRPLPRRRIAVSWATRCIQIRNSLQSWGQFDNKTFREWKLDSISDYWSSLPWTIIFVVLKDICYSTESKVDFFNMKIVKLCYRLSRNTSFLTFRRPRIVIYSYYKNQRDTIFLNFILVKNFICFGHIYCPSSGVLIRGGGGGVDKSLVLLGRKQSTATKLGIYSTYSPRSSMHFLARCSNFCKPLTKKFWNLSVQPGLRSSNDLRVGRKMATFQFFFSPGNRC